MVEAGPEGPASNLLFGGNWIRCGLASAETDWQIRTCRTYSDISLHFLVKGWTEVCTIEWEYSGFFRHPFQCLGLARHDQQFPIVSAFDCEAMRNIPVLFKVGDVEIDYISHFHTFNIIGREMWADTGHVNMYFISFTFHFGIIITQRCKWILVLFYLKYLLAIFWWLVNFHTLSLNFLDYQIFLVPIIFTVIWYVTIFNSLNWSDGIPGLTSGLSFVSFFVIFLLWLKLFYTDDYIGWVENALFILQMSLIIMTSVWVFWWYDVRQKMLMGDSGTMFLWFMLASLAIISGGKIATVVVVFWVYLIDAFYVIFKRVLSWKSPMSKDFSHLHHRLLQAGLSQKQILTFIYFTSFFFGITSLFLQTEWKVIVFIILIFVVVFINSIIDFILKTKRKTR